MNGCNIYDPFAQKSVDTDLLNEEVGVLLVDGTIVEIVWDNCRENVEEFPQFMVTPGMERAFSSAAFLCCLTIW